MFIATGLQGARHDSYKKEIKENRNINGKPGFSSEAVIGHW